MKDISEIIARYLLNIADKDELDDLSRWERKSEDNSRFLGSLRTFWSHPLEEKSSGLLTHARERLLTPDHSGSGNKRKAFTIFQFLKDCCCNHFAHINCQRFIVFHFEIQSLL